MSLKYTCVCVSVELVSLSLINVIYMHESKLLSGEWRHINRGIIVQQKPNVDILLCDITEISATYINDKPL